MGAKLLNLLSREEVRIAIVLAAALALKAIGTQAKMIDDPAA